MSVSEMARGVIVSFAILVPLMSLIKVAYAHYTPTWAVHIPGGKETAEAVASEHGFINLGEVSLYLKLQQKYDFFTTTELTMC